MQAPNITGLIRAWEAGSPEALNRLVEAAYPELRRIAHRYCYGGSRSATMQCTAVVNEAYLRLADSSCRNWKDRAHFFGFASQVIRHILVDYARERGAKKRGAGAAHVALADADAVSDPFNVDILELDDALEALAALDPPQARIVELRYFTGLSIPETAEVVGASESKVKREWIVAKSWIRRRLLKRGMHR
jgi:RNA polymerase sigma factor (TIGR02999 family)